MVRGDVFASRDIRANDRARQQVSNLFSLRTKQELYTLPRHTSSSRRRHR